VLSVLLFKTRIAAAIAKCPPGFDLNARYRGDTRSE